MKIVASIEARMGSTRLPGKVLKEIVGKPMLQLMIERIKYSKEIDDIIVATTTNSKDDKIAEMCNRIETNVYRGSEDDVLQRVADAVGSIKGGIIVELTGDCPLIDPYLMDEIIIEYKNKNVDYISNCHPYTFPEGFDVQVFSYKNLKWISENLFDKEVREHVSIYFYENPDKYRVVNYSCDQNLSRPDWHLSVDEEKDFELIKIIFEKFYHKKPDFTVYDIVEFLDKNHRIRGLRGR